MINSLLKISACLTLLLLCQTWGHAQILGPYGTSPIAIEVDANGTLWSTGTYGTGSLSVSGAGTRMIWYPAKAAFRAGYVSGNEWDDGYIGDYSVAMGQDTRAVGYGAIAMGVDCNANQYTGIAMGDNAYAYYQAVALGASVTASNNWTVAIGCNDTASGINSVAIGTNNVSSGAGSAALGNNSQSQGEFSTALGSWTGANTFCGVVLGQFNRGQSETGGTPSLTTWVGTDPLLDLGNGTNGGNTSDAFVVYKDGDVQTQGTITANAGVLTTPASVSQTDIPMYTGN